MESPIIEVIDSLNISKYNRYVEIMLGAAQSYIHLNPTIPSFLNDSNTDLINFYKNINDPELLKELKLLSTNWALIDSFCQISTNDILIAFQDYNTGIISSEDVEYMIRAIILMNTTHEEFIPLFDKNFVVSIDMFINALIKSVVSVLLKLKGDSKIENKNTLPDFFNSQIKTAFQSGFYEHFKNLVNWQKTELIDCMHLLKHLSSWFFLKELGKGQHMQYDTNGNLKTHFGGSECDDAYFKRRVEEVCNVNFTEKIKNATLYNLNPIDFVNEIKVNENDFVIANVKSKNTILAQGKNYSAFSNHIEQIKQIVTLNTNFLIIIDDKKTAMEFEILTQGKLKITDTSIGYCVSNIIN